MLKFYRNRTVRDVNCNIIFLCSSAPSAVLVHVLYLCGCNIFTHPLITYHWATFIECLLRLKAIFSIHNKMWSQELLLMKMLVLCLVQCILYDTYFMSYIPHSMELSHIVTRCLAIESKHPTFSRNWSNVLEYYHFIPIVLEHSKREWYLTRSGHLRLETNGINHVVWLFVLTWQNLV